MWEEEAEGRRLYLQQLVKGRGGWDIVLRPTLLCMEPYPSMCVATKRKLVENGRSRSFVGLVVGHQTEKKQGAAYLPVEDEHAGMPC